MTWCFIRTQNKARWTSRSAKYSLHAVHVHSYKSNQIKSLLLSHHHSTSALVSEILKSVLQTVQKKPTVYIWTVHIYRLYRRQCAKYTYIYSVHIVYYKDILSYTWHQRAISRRKSYQDIPNMDKCQAITVWKQLFSQKKKQMSLELRLRQYMIYLCFSSHLQAINKVYEQCSANWHSINYSI